jgi:hypothetical protein
VTPTQQKRWHTAVDVGHQFLADHNTPDGTGVKYEDVRAHFCWNMDEECWMAEGNSVKIVGSASLSKHERETLGRTSISLLKCGNAGGDWGPCVALAAGKTRDPIFTDEFLERNGAPRGSTIIMTETAYMTDGAFDELAENFCQGIRDAPIVRDHPKWWVFMTADGLHAHKMTEAAQRIFAEHKIYLLIEEADNSHVAQPFDKVRVQILRPTTGWSVSLAESMCLRPSLPERRQDGQV